MASNGNDVPGPSRNKSWTTDARGNNSSTSTPPPGFLTSEVRAEPASNASSLQKYLWSETGGAQQQQQQLEQQLEPQLEPQTQGARNQRSSSFKNIALVLGNGLAESIEDATRSDSNNLTDSFFSPTNKNNDMNYERHKRHAASRLLGAPGTSSSSPISHKAQEAGSLFGALDTAADSHRQPGLITGTNNNNNSGNHSNSDNNNINNDTMGSVPFRQNPTAAAFHPSYNNGNSNSNSSSNNNYSNNNIAGVVQRNDQIKSRLPVTKDLGLTVMEPSDSPYSGGRPNNNPTQNHSSFSMNNRGAATKPDVDLTYGIQSEMQNLNLWSESGNNGGGGGSRSPNPNPTSLNRSADSIDVGGPGSAAAADGNRRYESTSSPPPALDVEDELRPFTRDTNHHEPSRTLAILMASAIPSNEIGSLCESFGVTETFRTEFLDRIGVVFVSYSDMRCAQFAAMQLPNRLKRLSAGAGGVQVKFCVPLNSSSQNDESMVVINDLPNQVGVDNLGRLLSSFGAIRSLKNLGGDYGGSSYVVEFHDVQDAKQVVLELESSQPWGPDVSVEVGGRNPSDRKKGRELLALLGRWRNQGGGGGGGGGGGQVNRGGGRQPGGAAEMYRPHVDTRGMGGHRDGRYERGMPHEEHSPQHGYGPGPTDGRYPYNNNNNNNNNNNHNQYAGNHTGYPQQYRGSHHPSDHVVHGGRGTYVTRQISHQPPPHQQQQQQYYPPHQQGGHGNYPGGGSSVVSGGGSSRHTSASGYYTDDRSTGSRHRDDRSVGSNHSNVRSVNSGIDSMAGSTRDGQNQHLMLDLDIVENGMDTRTSLMVRNIPNKYTQQMLLSEFTENDHGPGVIDFFYLPIDFKNRCNRGYAFINFVDYQDILKFHRQYYGKHWRTFNSDKICDITYARIQGKAAMLKRFENSALMEKDEEYKPLVFVSSGPDKGTRLPFPQDPSRGS
jgi:hypothetical protein